MSGTASFSDLSDTMSGMADVLKSSTGRRNHANSRIADNMHFEGAATTAKEKKNPLMKSWDFQEEATEEFKAARRAKAEPNTHADTRAKLGVHSRVADAVVVDRVLPNVTKAVFVPKKGALNMWHGADI